MNMKIFSTAAAALVASSAYAGLDTGDTFTVSRTGLSGAAGLNVNWDSTVTDSSAAARSGGDFSYGGRIMFDTLKINGAVGSYGQMRAFCVEFSEAFPDDPIQYTVTEVTGVPENSPPGNMSANQAALIEDLYARHYSDVDSKDGESNFQFDVEAAAFQLVIWEISHEFFASTTLSGMAAELNVRVGAFQNNDDESLVGYSDVQTAADAMIASLGSGGFMGFSALRGATNPDNQDLLIVVPSPAIAGLAGLGLVGMRRRRR